jgi:prolyl oligopeptidase
MMRRPGTEDRVNALALALALAAAPAAPPAGPPRAEERPAADVYHGVGVADPYRWLEDGRDPAVKAWSDAQNAYARAFLDAWPSARALRERVRGIMAAPAPRWFSLCEEGGTLFAAAWRPPEQQPRLVVVGSPGDASSERTVVDPNALDRAGRTTIDFFVPSHDGRRVALSLSQNGTEDGTVHVYDVATGHETGDVLPRVNGGTAGGSLAWNADGTGFWYTRYPAPDERRGADVPFSHQVYFHRLGTPPSSDAYELGREFTDPAIAQVSLESSPAGGVAARVARGDGGEFEWFLRGAGGWARLSTYADELVRGRFGPDGSLWLVALRGSPRGRILRLPAGAAPGTAPAEVVPEGEGAAEKIEVTGSRLYVVETDGGPSRIRVHDLSGRRLADVPVLPVSAVEELTRSGPGVLYANTSYLEPIAWWRADDAGGPPRRTALVTPSPVDFSDCEVVREEAVSIDGTRIPVSIVRRKGTRLDGRNPTLLYGYGGFGISETPSFSATRRVWLEQGGVYAVAHVRSGGEFGEAWHRAGMLARKQNVFDDFAAASRMLVERGYATPARLAWMGGSNGGLLMGAMVTQHPRLARAVVAAVGVFDMLRVELHPNGAHNVTEFGTVKDPAQFWALRAYSPYHNVIDGAPYPAVLLTAGENDPRVDAYHARKMAARLQAATSSGAPILLRTTGGGHGIGSALDERIALSTDYYTFLFRELGVRWKAPPAPRLPTR